MMAWDTMAVLMAAYESNEKDAVFVDISDITQSRTFTATELPTPEHFIGVFQKQ